MKNRTWILVLIVLAVAFSLWVKLAKADGGIFVPKDRYSAETRQKAFIYYADQTENLTVLASFKGDASNFAWVVPTPNKPEINKGSVDLFNTLSDITKLETSGPDTVFNSSALGVGSPKSSPVEVISEKTVDVYDTAILKATDENALAKWLFDNGYSFPIDKSTELKSYVDNGWYFAIAKIRHDLQSDGGITTQLNEGMLTPLRLTFQTDKIIYPMKLTGIALTQTKPVTPATSIDESSLPPVDTSVIPIDLYVLSDHKTEQSMLSTDWANWITTGNIKTLNENLGGNIISEEKLFLTEMIGTVRVTDITDDFLITSAQGNAVYPTPVYKTAWFWILNLIALVLTPIGFALFPTGMIFILFAVLQKFVIKRKWGYILGLIYEIFFCLALIVTSAGMLLAITSGSSNGFLESGVIGLGIGSLITFVVALIATIRMSRHYKKTYNKPSSA